MAKTAVDNLITNLCTRMGWATTSASVPRADALRQLNIEERRISQSHSLSYLLVKTTIDIASTASTAVVPTTPAMDVGKSWSIGRSLADAKGKLIYVPPDEFEEMVIDGYGDWTATSPTIVMLANTTADPPVPTFHFKPANTTGATLTLPITYQRVVAALTDGPSSYSVLPEGYEDTLLLESAEAELKRQRREPGWDVLAMRVEKAVGMFYQGYRISREKPTTDREQEERKIAREKLSERV